MTINSLTSALVAACLVVPCAMAQPAAPARAAGALLYLDPADFIPERIMPPPPPHGSEQEATEIANLRASIAAATPQRLAQARLDEDHEEPSVFNATIGRDLASLPQTLSLLKLIQQEAESVTESAKHHFAPAHPFRMDPALLHCGAKANANATKSYPSGHAGFGWSVGWTLARLLPDKAPAIMARAQDYAFSRQLCGVHFASDTEASHVVGTLVADHLLNDPRLAARVAAARSELTGQ